MAVDFPAFAKGDRVLVVVTRKNQLNHSETYQVGEHGVVIEASENSSVVQVCLDGCDGRQGNYYVVEGVLPLMRRPVRQRFVHASVLHLQKQKDVMRGDQIVFVTESGKELLGHIIEVDEEGGTTLVQPMSVEDGERYGPLERRPWAASGDRCQMKLADVRCRVQLEAGNYLRDRSIKELREKGLLRDQDEETADVGDASRQTAAPLALAA
eukprot:TRINITY_DN3544_c0_g3_i1.p1 TRINITY_DN3544_c0_g3~~TRINITY_DN3544_c0_g3_i1.p1  ORF type:complete len:211 (+),score=53.83 TRINITY_DN3544_c0_g3_i1:55-687(+)